MDAAVQEILANSKRLLDDAQVLAARGSFRTAMALSILSLEESGKACLVRWKKAGHLANDITDDIRAMHIAKQRVLTVYKGLNAIRSVAVIRRVGDQPQDRRMNAEAFTDLVRTTLAKSLVVPKSQAELGLLDYVKQSGFYVDLNENLETISPTIPATQEWFELLCEDAQDALRMAEAEDEDQFIMAVMYAALGGPSISGKARRDALDDVLAGIRRDLSEPG